MQINCGLSCNIIVRFDEKIFKGQEHLVIKSAGVSTGKKSVLNFFWYDVPKFVV